MPSPHTSPSIRPLLFRWLDSIEADDRLKRPVRHTALALGREMNIHGHQAFPSHARLADRIGCDERTVRRHLDLLRDLGWLSWYNVRREGVRLTSNRYTPLIPEGYEIDTRINLDKSVQEMSEYNTGETFYETNRSSDILDRDLENTYVDLAVVAMRQHFCIQPSILDGHTRLRESLLQVVIRHGLDGLRTVYDKVTSDSPASLISAKSPCRVLAHRVSAAEKEIKVNDSALTYAELVSLVTHD
ncbi:unannotated protein [freshwater metagenome]|uniref:Unannotated protein n=1 Tax=freshwater metagenome TaxID=449393 RepID=A0A6J6NAA0_9ZZZZ|nr:hypothetical protein [Actinomycetota bacterium]